jgi:hypothetical protein
VRIARRGCYGNKAQTTSHLLTCSLYLTMYWANAKAELANGSPASGWRGWVTSGLMRTVAGFPYGGSDAVVLAIILIALAAAFAYVRARLKSPIGVTRH